MEQTKHRTRPGFLTEVERPDEQRAGTDRRVLKDRREEPRFGHVKERRSGIDRRLAIRQSTLAELHKAIIKT